ncbi:hypothetical protein ACWEQL_17485 [Kitasatospora sp. NPDC004240]
MRKLVAGIALVTAVTAVTTTAAAAAPATTTARHQSLHAWALMNDRGPGPTPAGERLTARVDARSKDGVARGHATVQHVFPGNRIVRAEIDVACLTTTADGAVTVTGPIESLTFTVPEGETPPAPAPSTWHPETGLTFYPADGDGVIRVGWAGADALDYTAPPRATRCGATEASLWVFAGGYSFRR